jgi:hypothetical protein
MPTIPTATDAEIKAAAKQLGLNGAHSALPQRKASVGQALQSLAHGRSHMVAVEIKPSSRRHGDTSSASVIRSHQRSCCPRDSRSHA